VRRLFWFVLDCATLAVAFLGFLAYKFLRKLMR